MQNISNFHDCYGCSVCAIACGKKAITMQLNVDGFYKPVVDTTKCVDCGICLDVCAFNDSIVKQDKEFQLSCYAAWTKNDEVRKMCTSGGGAFELGRYLLQKGYGVIGCRYNSKKHIAEHYLAETEEELMVSIGSKYIQSSTIEGFSQIKKGKKYLITGTPCQIDSLRRYVQKRKMEDDVILLDFFCHGVPSMLMWKRYSKELEQKIGDYDNIVWRDKAFGWHDSYVIKVADKYSSRFSNGDLFFQMFLGDRCLGKACYESCKYKYNNSAADIRIGDLWGRAYEKDEDGVNGVVCFTQKGKDLLNEMQSILHIEPSSLDIVGESQMKKCAHKPISYKYVMKHLKLGTPLSQIHKTAYCFEFIERIPRKIKYYIKRLPSKLLEYLRKLKNED